MAVFNSLGSNYSWSDVWRHLFASSKKDASEQLVQLLNKRYGGQTSLTYKGREALETALRRSGLPSGSAIGINGFTCYAVYRAVENAGYKVLPIDISPGQMNFGLDELKYAHSKHSELKAIIVQNSLGYPAEISSLAEYSQNAGLLVIEDLAHSTGLVYDDGREAGTIADFTMLSFSQDKPLDVVAGGAVIDRRGQTALVTTELPLIGAGQHLKNRCYPLWTAIIRTTYSIGLGRYLHFALKKLNLMATPMSDDLEGFHRMTDTTASLILKRWQNLTSELAHRREIAQIYQQQIPIDYQVIHKTSGQPSYLRFPILAQDRASLVNFLRQQQIYIGDTWYDAPIGPQKYLAKTDYNTGTCPNAEELAEHIVNLPTHIHVTPEVANNICAKIKLWQSSQQKS